MQNKNPNKFNFTLFITTHVYESRLEFYALFSPLAFPMYVHTFMRRKRLNVKCASITLRRKGGATSTLKIALIFYPAKLLSAQKENIISRTPFTIRSFTVKQK
jgi:hypothetical protein